MKKIFLLILLFQFIFQVCVVSGQEQKGDGNAGPAGNTVYNTDSFLRNNPDSATGYFLLNPDEAKMGRPDIVKFFNESVSSLTRKAPYLLYDGVDTAMQINWQLYSSLTCTLQWGTNLNYDSSAQTVEYGDDHQHRYVFYGLARDTRYYYEVTIGAETYTGNFKTAPPDTSSSFSFFAYGDTRTNPAAHDSVARRILEAIQNDSTTQTFILVSGDLVANGDIEADWDQQFFDPVYSNIQQMLQNLPYMACMGNHEQQGTGFAKYFPYSFYHDPRFYGSFDYANAHFVIIDQYTDYSVGSTQYDWVENDLASSDKPWKIILLHQPGWSAGGHSNDSDVQNYIQPLCETYGVQFVICGHNHYYARAEVSGVVHITTGGGGAPLYPPNPSADSVKVVSKSYHYSKFTFDNNLCTLVAVDTAGIVIDSFLLRIYTCLAPSGLYADSITRTTANLNWTESGSATQWQVRVDTAGFDTTGIVPLTIASNPYQLTGLTANTSYDWYIRAYCGAGDSSMWVGPRHFTTRCDPYTVPFIETFDGLDTLPDCWFTLVTDSLGNVSLVDSLAWSDTLAAIITRSEDTSAFLALITPDIGDLTAQDNQIRFMARTYQDSTALIIGTMSNPSDTLAFTGYDTLTILPVYNEYTVLFDTNYKLTDTYIAFKHGMSDTALSIFIDDFSYEPMPYLSMWLGTADDHWNNPANWRSGVVPGAGDTVYITLGYTNPPTIYTNVTIKSLRTQTGVVIKVKNNARLTITGN